MKETESGLFVDHENSLHTIIEQHLSFKFAEYINRIIHKPASIYPVTSKNEYIPDHSSCTVSTGQETVEFKRMEIYPP